MKKVLSVLLAAAMVMGMSVSAMAKPGAAAADDKEYGTETVINRVAIADDEDVWGDVVIQRGTKFVSTNGKLVNPNTTKNITGDFANIAHAANTDYEDVVLEAGDIIYIEITKAPLYKSVPSNWAIKLSAADYIEGASLVMADYSDAGKDTPLNNLGWHMGWKGYDQAGHTVWAKVVIDDTIDHYSVDSVLAKLYLYDSYNKTSSVKVTVDYDFADFAEVELTADDLDWVLAVNGAKTYKFTGSKAKVATINFNNKLAFAEFKMYPEESYTLSAVEKYNKDLTKEYDEDISVITFRLPEANVDLFFPAAKDNKQIVAVVDGELVAVEAEFVAEHDFSNGSTAKGYLVENAEYDAYAIVSADLEIAEEEVEAPVEADKANPETGAADFVGAAVAMAVVSVAAAGALALKK